MANKFKASWFASIISTRYCCRSLLIPFSLQKYERSWNGTDLRNHFCYGGLHGTVCAICEAEKFNVLGVCCASVITVLSGAKFSYWSVKRWAKQLKITPFWSILRILASHRWLCASVEMKLGAKKGSLLYSAGLFFVHRWKGVPTIQNLQ